MHQRRGARVECRFWVQVTGIDPEPVLRLGNVSGSGAYIEIDRRIGAPGAVRWLSLNAEDGGDGVNVLARIIRVAIVEDVGTTAVKGVAVEFMLADDAKRAEIESLVRRILQGARKDAPSSKMQVGLDARLHRPAAAEPLVGRVSTLTQGGMVVETAWPIAVGETVECEVRAPASKRVMRLRGEAVSAAPGAGGDVTPRYRVEIRFREPPAAAGGSSLEAAIGAVLEQSLTSLEEEAETSAPSKNELAGVLGQIALPSLLSFFELERLSGVLVVEGKSATSTLWVRDGRVVDVETGRSRGAKRELVRAALGQREGSFRFTVGPVDRADALNVSTGALLLDLAREEDEAAAT